MVQSQNIQLSNHVKIHFISKESETCFFGYYNYSPLNFEGTKLLSHKTDFEGRMPSREDVAEVGYFDLIEDKWYSIEKTNAFNWQQGAMLQWVGPDFNTRFIFNAVSNGKFVSKIHDINSKKTVELPEAIYGVDPKGKFSISLNFERCFWTRAYSYVSIENEEWNKRIPEQDGIVKIDIQTGEKKTIIGLNQFLQFNDIKDDGLTSHWFEHIMINPSGTRFSFYHRFGTKNEYRTECYTADINGNNIWKHPTKEDDTISHIGWKDAESYVLFTYPTTKLSNWYSSQVEKNKFEFARLIYRKFVKPFFKEKTVSLVKGSHYALSIDQEKIVNHWNTGLLSRDGHPSFTKDQRFLLSDTYADEQKFRDLFLFDTLKNKTINLGRFYSTYNECGWRADLHPRFSHDENFVIIDTTHNGVHQLLMLEIDWESIIK